jgi:type IV secretory pathway VirD2 relaxase
MAGDDDQRFRPRLGRPRSAGGASTKFTSQVLRAVSRAGPRPRHGRRTNAARLGRGAIPARLLGSAPARHQRRVIVKTRLVLLAQAGARSTATHLAYIERDAVGREGEPGQAYGREADRIDTGAFEERGRGDRHQFRIIVAPEDGEALGDLKAFTRDLMAQMEEDLGTRLDWVAVDHHDTGNPHSHILLRGCREDGQDLVIARDYVSHGMRLRAGELATQWLGPRTEREIAAGLDRDATADRWTGIDRALARAADPERMVAAEVSPAIGRTAALRRLRHLERLGLAEPVGNTRWRLSPRHEPALRALGERGDIIRTLQRSLGDEREIALPDAARPVPVVGRITGKGLVDEMGDTAWLAIDGVDGKAHYARLPSGADPADWPVGGIVELAADGPRAADRTIAALAEDGTYSVARHRAAASADARPGRDPDRFVDAHVRRLEALRRAGLVERLSEDLWRVPANLANRGPAHDRARGGGVALRSRQSLALQTRAIGATWLDEVLVAGGAPPARGGFGAELSEALEARAAVLEREGLAQRQGGRLLLARGLLDQLRDRDLASAAREIAAGTGLVHRPPGDGPVAGTYVRAIDRPSGRFALLDDGAGGFALVPWRLVIEQRLGQWIGGTMRGNDVSWDLGRSRGLGV